MKIIVQKSELLDAALPSAGFASGKNTIAAIEGILFRTVGDKECELTAYDLEKGMKTSFVCIVEEPGCGIINCTRFLQIVRVMPDGNITVAIDEATLRTTISAGKSQFELRAQSGKDFPDLPELRGDRGFTIKEGVLRSILQKTQFAIAVNNARPELNGLNLKIQDGMFTAVSCDGSRLSLYTEKAELQNVGTAALEFDIIIPGKTVAELMRFISDSETEMKINVARKHIIFFVGRYILFTRLIDARYVEYERFIPKSPKLFVTAETAAFISALERALLVTEDRQQGQTKSPVICRFEDSVLTVSSSSITGRVSDEIGVDQQGDGFEIAFNCRFLTDAMKVCDCESVRLSLTSSLMGMTVEPTDNTDERRFLLLILPVRNQ